LQPETLHRLWEILKKAEIEDAFDKLLRGLTPDESLLEMAKEMVNMLWQSRNEAKAEISQSLAAEKQILERGIAQMLDRIVETENPSIIATYEKRITEMQDRMIVLEEKLAKGTRTSSDPSKLFRTYFKFLSNPHELWVSDSMAHRRMVLKLCFTEKLRYYRNEGFRTAPIALPIRVLDELRRGQSCMVGPPGLEPGTCRL
jgi:site-specific DNA recombinase